VYEFNFQQPGNKTKEFTYEKIDKITEFFDNKYRDNYLKPIFQTVLSKITDATLRGEVIDQFLGKNTDFYYSGAKEKYTTLFDDNIDTKNYLFFDGFRAFKDMKKQAKDDNDAGALTDTELTNVTNIFITPSGSTRATPHTKEDKLYVIGSPDPKIPLHKSYYFVKYRLDQEFNFRKKALGHLFKLLLPIDIN